MVLIWVRLVLLVKTFSSNQRGLLQKLVEGWNLGLRKMNYYNCHVNKSGQKNSRQFLVFLFSYLPCLLSFLFCNTILISDDCFRVWSFFFQEILGLGWPSKTQVKFTEFPLTTESSRSLPTEGENAASKIKIDQ